MQLGKTARPREITRMAALLVLLLLATALQRCLRSPSGDVPGEVNGYARLVDGDSFFVSGDEVRLVGIDAPEGRQTCRREGRDWECGEAARDELRRLIAGRAVRCRAEERDQHGRLLAICDAGGQELNRAMVASGLAVSFGSRFKTVEQEARAARRGLWGAEFERPQEWRRSRGIH